MALSEINSISRRELYSQLSEKQIPLILDSTMNHFYYDIIWLVEPKLRSIEIAEMISGVLSGSIIAFGLACAVIGISVCIAGKPLPSHFIPKLGTMGIVLSSISGVSLILFAISIILEHNYLDEQLSQQKAHDFCNETKATLKKFSEHLTTRDRPASLYYMKLANSIA